MTYDVLIRHTSPTSTGEGVEHWLEERQVDARSEEEAFLGVKHGPDDHIACIDSWHHRGVSPFSLETGDPNFFTNAHRPALIIDGPEDRAG